MVFGAVASNGLKMSPGFSKAALQVIIDSYFGYFKGLDPALDQREPSMSPIGSFYNKMERLFILLKALKKSCDVVRSTIILQDVRYLVAAYHPSRHTISDRSCFIGSSCISCQTLELAVEQLLGGARVSAILSPRLRHSQDGRFAVHFSKLTWCILLLQTQCSNTPPKMARRMRCSNTPRALGLVVGACNRIYPIPISVFGINSGADSDAGIDCDFGADSGVVCRDGSEIDSKSSGSGGGINLGITICFGYGIIIDPRIGISSRMKIRNIHENGSISEPVLIPQSIFRLLCAVGPTLTDPPFIAVSVLVCAVLFFIAALFQCGRFFLPAAIFIARLAIISK